MPAIPKERKSKYYLVCKTHKEKIPAFGFSKQLGVASDIEGNSELRDFLVKHKWCSHLIVMGNDISKYSNFHSNAVPQTLLDNQQIPSKEKVKTDKKVRRPSVSRHTDSNRGKRGGEESSNTETGELVDSIQPTGTGTSKGPHNRGSEIPVYSPTPRGNGRVKKRNRSHVTTPQRDRFMIDGVLHVVNDPNTNGN